MVAADRELSPWGGRDGVVASELSHTGLTCGAVPRQRDYPCKKNPAAGRSWLTLPFSWLGVPGAGPCGAADSGPSHARPQMAARERPPRAGCPPAASPVGQHRGLRNLGCGLGAAVLCPPSWSCVFVGLWQLRRGLGETFLVQLWSGLCFSVGQRWKKAPEGQLPAHLFPGGSRPVPWCWVKCPWASPRRAPGSLLEVASPTGCWAPVQGEMALC